MKAELHVATINERPELVYMKEHVQPLTLISVRTLTNISIKNALHLYVVSFTCTWYYSTSS